MKFNIEKSILVQDRVFEYRTEEVEIEFPYHFAIVFDGKVSEFQRIMPDSQDSGKLILSSIRPAKSYETISGPILTRQQVDLKWFKYKLADDTCHKKITQEEFEAVRKKVIDYVNSL